MSYLNPIEAVRQVQEFWQVIYERGLSRGREVWGAEPIEDHSERPASERGPQTANANPFNLPEAKSCNVDDLSGGILGSDGKVLISEDSETGDFYLCRVGCKRAICPRCGKQKASKDADKLEEVLKGWRHPMMLTFTLNPKAFPDQREIFEWLKEKRYISNTIRFLYEAGYLESREYFAAMEFQMGEHRTDGSRGTEQVHFHVVVRTKAGYVDFDRMSQIWNRGKPSFRRDYVPEPGKKAPQIGFAQFEKPKSAHGIASYCAKYVAKSVEFIPAWYIEWLNEGHNATLVTKSRGLFAEFEPERKPIEEVDESRKRGPYEERRTLEKAIEFCGTNAVLLEKRATGSGVKYRFVKTAGVWEDQIGKFFPEQCEHLADANGVHMQRETAVMIMAGWGYAADELKDDNTGLQQSDIGVESVQQSDTG